MEYRTYATEEGIRSYLDSLKGLHRLVQDRQAAGRRREMMPVFCVLGRYLLLADGGIGDLTGIAGKTASARAAMTLEEFERYGRQKFRDDWKLAYRTPARLAPPEAACPECGRGWTLSDCHDALPIYEERTELLALTQDEAYRERIRLEWTFHADCHRKRVERDAWWWAEDFLVRAGLPEARLEMVTGRIPDDPTPWFRLETPAGPVSFGRRGVGFGLEWKETGRPLPDLFREVHKHGHYVKRGDYYVHLPDEAYLLAQFNRLRHALGT